MKPKNKNKKTKKKKELNDPSKLFRPSYVKLFSLFLYWSCFAPFYRLWPIWFVKKFCFSNSISIKTKCILLYSVNNKFSFSFILFVVLFFQFFVVVHHFIPIDFFSLFSFDYDDDKKRKSFHQTKIKEKLLPGSIVLSFSNFLLATEFLYSVH